MGRSPGNNSPQARRILQPQVFSDVSRKRLARVRLGFIAVIGILAIWATIFTLDIASTPLIQSDDVTSKFNKSNDLPDIFENRTPGTLLLDETRERTADLTTPARRITGCGNSGQAGNDSGAGRNTPPAKRVFAFLPTSPDWSFLSLRLECGMIDVLMPEWFTLGGIAAPVQTELLDPDARKALRKFIEGRSGTLDVLPTVRLGRETNRSEFWSTLISDPVQINLVENLTSAAQSVNAAGLCMDLGIDVTRNQAQVAGLIAKLTTRFAAEGLETCLVVNDEQARSLDQATLNSVNHVVFRAYQQPWVGASAAPLAAADWFERTTREALSRITPDKLVIALGSFATDWVSGQPMPAKIAYGEAMSRIERAGAKATLARSSGNMFSSFMDTDGQRHQIWMLDAVSVHNQLLKLEGLGIRNVAMSDLGFEDPGVWSVLSNISRRQTDLSRLLSEVQLDNYVSYRGEGPFLRYDAPMKIGRRSVVFDGRSGEIIEQKYSALPLATTITRYGKAAPHQIVLTFDDGPDPKYTTEILDILKAQNVPAAFFLVGNNAVRTEDLVMRIVDEGHEIGSHTFMHPRMDQVSQYRAIAEINSVQKLINGLTGRLMMLYREPFMRGDGPLTAQRADPIRQLQNAGYIIAGSDIVPNDWADASAESIVSNVLAQVTAGAGNVIVLHDAGSDRSETVKALPILIAELRAQGYEFASMAEALGTSRDAVMPVIDDLPAALDGWSFKAIAWLQQAMVTVFWAAIAIGTVRAIVMILLSLTRRRAKTMYEGAAPSATIVIPAYNEDVVIAKSVRRALACDYPGLQVIVVDDGSRDKTLKVLRREFADHPRVRILTQRNQGKWAALNHAYRVIETEIAVCIDADTQIDPMAVSWLCRHFADPKVGAVAGKIEVGNSKRLLTMLQSLEYITAQGIDRRASEKLNAMLVVPGAIGAWRVDAVREAGLYSNETLSEDADLTVAVNRANYRVVYEENAVAHTEAPDRIKTFLQQRLRWSLGMLQVGWKHKRAMREGRAVGLVSLTDLAIFGYLFPILAPIADVFFFYLIYDFISIEWLGREAISEAPPAYWFLGYLALPMLDILTAWIALRIDGKERWYLLLLFPFQRLFYRQLLYLSVFRAILRAITGKLAKWQKADRSGFVTQSTVPR